MNGFERIVAALNGEKPDRIPVMLHNFMVAAEELNVSMEKFRNDPKIIAGAFIKSVEKYALDGVLVDIDTVTLAGSVGVEVDFPVNAPARSHRGMLGTLGQVKNLKPVNIENYKYVQVWLEAVRLLKDYFGDGILIRGNCDQAPFSLACLIRGIEPWMMDLYTEEPSLIRELLDYSCGVSVRFIQLMAQTGAHMASNGDSLAGPEVIDPELYAEWALPYEKKLADTARDLGMYYTLHICGNTELILEPMVKTGADAFELDYKTDMHKAFDVLHNTATFTGNIDPGGVLANGSKELVRQKTLELLEVFSRTNRFILNAGCALPPNTPEENLRTLVETARNFY